jgi:NADH pyrophosphatase NudC (nudix superfamily)
MKCKYIDECPSVSDWCSDRSEENDCLTFLLTANENLKDENKQLKEQPIIKAEWIEDEDGDGRHCSNCMSDYCYLFEQAKRYKFCPNCGRKMKDEQKELEELEEIK